MNAPLPATTLATIHTDGAAFRAAAVEVVRALGTPTTRELLDALGATEGKERNVYRTRLAKMETKGALRSFVEDGPGFSRVTRWVAP